MKQARRKRRPYHNSAPAARISKGALQGKALHFPTIATCVWLERDGAHEAAS
jgi:hypothetical protein